MPAKSSRKRKAKRAPRQRPAPRSTLRRRLLVAAGLLLMVLGGYVAYLDYLVQDKFAGRRWALPAHVYARPLELYPGLALSAERFESELRRLGYRAVYAAAEPGTFARRGRGFDLVTREFTFGDGHEPSRRLSVEFSAGSVERVAIRGESGQAGPVRLDPMFIGGIYPGHQEDRILVRLDDVPATLVDALIVTEDRTFYTHSGLDLRAIGRALWANLQAGQVVQGGSTITQQLVKSFFLSNERTLWRKANEALMALLLEFHYDKPEILGAYLNEVYLGQDGARAIHGVGLASQFYFDRSISELSLPQTALLVALVRGPSYYDPRRQPQRARARRDLVLDVMVEQGVLDADQARRARQAPLGVGTQAPSGATSYPAFLDLVRRQLREDYRAEDLSSQGLRIMTTLEPHAQAHTERVVATRVAQLERSRGLTAGTLESAAVVLRLPQGEVIALVGGRRPRYAGFNRALDAQRPIGSLIKPVVYLAALEADPSRSLLAPISDEPLSVPVQGEQDWSPRNYDDISHGVVPLYAALANSYNQATVRLGLEIGVDRVATTVQRLGLNRGLNRYPSLLLGAVMMSPVEVAQVYSTLASEGFRSRPRAIGDVLDVQHRPLKRYPLEVEQVVNPDTVRVLNSALEAVLEVGTARSVRAHLPDGLRAAGKTGTTNDLRDSWFAGFSAEHLVVVWVGADDNSSVGLTGSSGALPMWADIMNGLNTATLATVDSDSLEHLWVDPDTQLLADERCNGAVRLAFLKGTAPERYAPCAGGGVREAIDKTMDWFRGLFK
ncbi:MAG: penicillin-binding protein 1B [Gammaproteobacteria bacterium SG8_47]|nr:MAG: penicillin-binding protein 1B [Gammaproteobacteria bacterium SG8_47]